MSSSKMPPATLTWAQFGHTRQASCMTFKEISSFWPRGASPGPCEKCRVPTGQLPNSCQTAAQCQTPGNCIRSGSVEYRTTQPWVRFIHQLSDGPRVLKFWPVRQSPDSRAVRGGATQFDSSDTYRTRIHWLPVDSAGPVIVV